MMTTLLGTPSWAKRNLEEALAVVGVPPRYRKVNPDEKIHSDERLSILLDDWLGHPWCVVLEGANGSGKTWAATKILARWLVSERVTIWEAAWVSTPDLIDRLRHEIASGGEALEDYSRRKLLVIDDWASLRRTDFSTERMRLLIERRYDSMLATIVTTDEPLESIEPRLADRMAEEFSGQSYIVSMGERSRRHK